LGKPVVQKVKKKMGLHAAGRKQTRWYKKYNEETEQRQGKKKKGTLNPNNPKKKNRKKHGRQIKGAPSYQKNRVLGSGAWGFWEGETRKGGIVQKRGRKDKRN